ncbi:hypothetical protein Mgra_00004769, partial [Meloidogyne graminicola]
QFLNKTPKYKLIKIYLLILYYIKFTVCDKCIYMYLIGMH